MHVGLAATQTFVHLGDTRALLGAAIGDPPPSSQQASTSRSRLAAVPTHGIGQSPILQMHAAGVEEGALQNGQLAARRAESPTSIDLFCGAGGLTLGLTLADFRTVLASDNWLPARETFSHNFPSVPICDSDARELNARDLLRRAGVEGPPDLVVGGPPCQGFSSAGARRADDRRNTLVGLFGRLVADLGPRGVLFENVEGFLTSADGDHVVDLMDPLVEAGYRVVLRKINVANYGVPQLRKRVIAIGLRGTDPEFPSATHRAVGAPGVHRVGSATLPLAPNVDEALRGLPSASSAPSESPTDHVGRVMRSMDLARARGLRPGQTMRDLPSDLRHESYERRANRRVSDGMPTERRGGAPAGLRRLRGDQPSKAITGAAPRELLHPHEDRPLTLRECARLQTFPDDFEFRGTLSEKAVLIGNAVPPQFARALAESLRPQLEAGRSEIKTAGALVAYELTAAEGVSPALANVIERLGRRYGAQQELALAI